MASAESLPLSAFSMAFPLAREITRPAESTFATFEFETENLACEVTSRSSPSAYFASTRNLCEALAPHKVTSWGTKRNDSN